MAIVETPEVDHLDIETVPAPVLDGVVEAVLHCDVGSVSTRHVFANQPAAWCATPVTVAPMLVARSRA
jgi:hypothetical protein